MYLLVLVYLIKDFNNKKPEWVLILVNLLFVNLDYKVHLKTVDSTFLVVSMQKIIFVKKDLCLHKDSTFYIQVPV